MLETDGYIDNPTQKGWLTAILELGAWFGALFSGFVAEVLSRKYGILCATGVFILGVIVQITAISGGHNEILAGRFITYDSPLHQIMLRVLMHGSGIGVGSLSVIVPMYNSECAPP